MAKFTRKQFRAAESRVIKLKWEYKRNAGALDRTDQLHEKIEAEMDLSPQEHNAIAEQWSAVYMQRERSRKAWMRAKKRYLRIAEALGVDVRGFRGLKLTD